MKTHFLVNTKTILSLALVALLFSCDTNNDNITASDVAGTYVGTLTAATTTSRVSGTQAVLPATTTVKNIGNQIEIHCVADNFDETLMLDLYENGEEMMVCITGQDFEDMYGHMLGEGNMGGNMQGNNSQWMQHLNNEHQEGDEHFGGFNMQDHTFNFTFRMNNGDFHFQGIKN